MHDRSKNATDVQIWLEDRKERAARKAAREKSDRRNRMTPKADPEPLEPK